MDWLRSCGGHFGSKGDTAGLNFFGDSSTETGDEEMCPAVGSGGADGGGDGAETGFELGLMTGLFAECGSRSLTPGTKKTVSAA